jgi:hypothetical protein
LRVEAERCPVLKFEDENHIMVIVHKGKMIFFCLQIVGCVSTGQAAIGFADNFADLVAGL